MRAARIYLLLFLALAGFFVFFAHAIVRITIFQVRLDISRREILGYELASNLLHSRFENLWRSGEDFDGEIRLSVLESRVLNAEPNLAALRPGVFERSGLVAVNVVRLLGFKSFLRLDEQAEQLFLLQYAFHMQRKKRYKQATRTYDRLESRVLNRPEDHAFILLHGGYSHALAGHFGDAVTRLKRVRREYAGTHFAHSAGVLLDFLLHRGGEAMVAAEDTRLPAARRAAAYYRAGRFQRAVAMLGPRADGLDDRTRLLYARSLEESGLIDEAAVQYRALVEAPGPADLRRRANRRLLLLGNFYGAGSAIKSFAEGKAVQLNDTAALRQIEKRRVLYQQPLIVERMKQEPTALPASLVKELRSELARVLPVENRSEKNRPADIPFDRTGSADPEPVPSKRQPAAGDKPTPAEKSPPPGSDLPPLRIVLKNGEEIAADQVEVTDGGFLVAAPGGLRRVDAARIQGVLGRDEKKGIRMNLDGIPLRGVRLDYQDGNILIEPPR